MKTSTNHPFTRQSSRSGTRTALSLTALMLLGMPATSQAQKEVKLRGWGPYQWSAASVNFGHAASNAWGAALALCGNGRPEGAEECDDGNTVSGDGCDSQCKKEVPDAPPATPYCEAPPGPLRVAMTTQWLGDTRCMDVAADNRTPQLDACGKSTAQIWHLKPAANGSYTLTSDLHAGKCLDIQNSGDRDRPWLQPCANYSGQLWKVTRAANGYNRLTTAFRGADMCLDVVNDGTNRALQLATCSAASGQLWKLTDLR